MRGIKKQILLPVLGVVLITLSVAIWVVTHTADGALIDAGREKVRNVAAYVGSRALEKVNRAKGDVVISAEIPTLLNLLDPDSSFIYEDREAFQNAANSLMLKLGEACGYYETFYVVSDKGMTLASSVAATVGKLDISNRAWFHEAMKTGEMVVSEPFISRLTGDVLVAVIKRFEFNGHVGAIVGSLQIQKVTKDVLKIGNNDWLRTVIVSKEGMTIVSSNDAEPAARSYKDADWFTKILSEKNGSVEITEDNKARLLLFYNLPDTDFYALSFADKQHLLEPSRTVMLVSALGLVVAVILSFGIIYMVVSPITGSIHQLATHADEIRHGKLDTEIVLKRKDELGMLADALNKMVANLRQLIVKSEAATQAKSDFLSRMSHEIRTPINAIIGMSKIASDTSDLTKAHDCIKKIDSSSKLLLGLINDVLDMSKIEANKMELLHETFDFERMLMDISNIIAIRSEEKHQKLHINMDMTMHRFFMGDEMRISQVIMNLLSNAVKFTPEYGTVRMQVRALSSDETHSRIEVSVTDTGIGISQENQSQLFKAFEQADGGIARKFGGTGLGLVISKSIVHMMHGEIGVESKEGEGSTFTFDILLEHAESDQTTTNLFRGVDVSNLQVMLLDQEEETREYFSRIIESFNIKCMVSASVEECLESLGRANKQKNGVSIVFVDWQALSDENKDLCARIKKQFSCYTVALMSAVQWSEIESRAEEFGLNKHLSKPLFPSNLMNMINELIGMPINVSEVTRTNRYRFAGFHILLVEDLEINREIVFHALSDTRIKISNAEDGKIAVDMFEKNPEEYNLILMDVNMPEMDGYEATRRIRDLPNEWAKKIPILAMTANAFSEDVKKSLDAGMDDHINKPLDFDKLLSKLHHYLGKPPLKQESPSSDSIENHSGESVKTDQPINEALINLDKALDLLGGSTDIYKALLSAFVQNSGFAGLIKNFEARDLKGATQSAHAIKGASGNLSLDDVYNNIVMLEASLKQGDFDEALYQTCLNSYERTKREIERLVKEL